MHIRETNNTESKTGCRNVLGYIATLRPIPVIEALVVKLPKF